MRTHAQHQRLAIRPPMNSPLFSKPARATKRPRQWLKPPSLKVYRKISTQVENFNPANRSKHLAEIHAAPEWLWIALGKQTIKDGWNAVLTNSKVAAMTLNWSGN